MSSFAAPANKVVKEAEAEEPPYGDSKDPKLTNVLKVRHVPVDDPNIVLYVRNLEEI